MAINLSNKVSREDREKVHRKNNPPEYEEGFEPDSGDNFDDLFDSLDDLDFDFDDDLFGGASSTSGLSNGYSESNNIFGTPSNDIFGTPSNDIFGTPSNDIFGKPSNGGFGTSFGTPISGFGQPKQQETKPDAIDVGIKSVGELFKALGVVFKEIVGSFKYRNIDDFGFLGRNLIITGSIMLPVGAVIGLIGTLLNINGLSFKGLGTQIILCGGVTLGTGLGVMGTAAFVLDKIGIKDKKGTINNIPETMQSEDNVIDDYEDLMSELDDLFSESFDDLDESEFEFEFEDDDDLGDNEDTFNISYDVGDTTVDIESAVDDVRENQYITRELLVDTFKGILPTNTPTFSSYKNIDYGSEDFESLEVICLKALSNVLNCEVDEVDSSLEEARENYFSYELRLKRVKRMTKTDNLARELEVYFRSSSSDTAINASVDIEGDFYNIIVTKGESDIVTIGDAFRQPECVDFYRNRDKKIPVLIGVDNTGKMILEDAMIYDTMMITGKPRSGKSWYVLSLLSSMMLFNSPDDVSFIIVDPKKSNLFNNVSLMPHVIGLHDDSNILGLLDELIDIEAERRKKIHADHKCDDIWELREKGIKMPVIFLLIDEYITVRSKLEEQGRHKELDNKIRTLMSQLPSLGIRLIFIPHRSTGIVDKTNRTMLQFTAAVRADIEDVNDTLGVKDWKIPLTRIGDIALKTSSMTKAKFIRTATLSTSNAKNTELIKTASKIFYKMGVRLPDTDSLRLSANIDREEVKRELYGDDVIEQFDANSIKEELDNIDDFNEVSDMDNQNDVYEGNDGIVDEDDILNDDIFDDLF